MDLLLYLSINVKLPLTRHFRDKVGHCMIWLRSLILTDIRYPCILEGMFVFCQNACIQDVKAIPLDSSPLALNAFLLFKNTMKILF